MREWTCSQGSSKGRGIKEGEWGAESFVVVVLLDAEFVVGAEESRNEVAK